MQAAGIYLRVLRERRGLSREDVASQLETDKTQIQRIENGSVDTRGSLLLRFVRAVHGNMEHIADLLLNEHATAEDGRALAQQWLSDEERAQIQQRVDAVPDADVELALAVIRELRARGQQGAPSDAHGATARFRPGLRRRRRGG